MSLETGITLYTISASHFCEKVRWTLDHKGIPFEEVAWVPILHLTTVRKLKVAKTSLPVIQYGDKSIQESFEIMKWLEQQRPTPALFPKKSAQEKTIAELDEKFNQIGAHLRRVVYWILLSYRKESIQALGHDVVGWQKTLLPWLFPMLRIGIKKGLNIHADSYQRSMGKVKQGLDFIEEQLNGSKYLVADRFTAADLSAASLLAPLSLPDEHPVYSKLAIPEKFFEEIASIREHPTLRWVHQIYRQHRRTVSKL